MTPAFRFSAAFFAVALALTAAASAQTAAPATPTVTPAPNCEKPGDPPAVGSSELGKASAAERQKRWTTAMRTYLECVKAFHAEQEAAARPHIRAANAAIEEYNRAMKVYNDYLDFLKQ